MWRTNQRCRVIDPWRGINAQLLITGLEFALTPEVGTHTKITVQPVEAFELLQLPRLVVRHKAQQSGAWISREQAAAIAAQAKQQRGAGP